MPLPLPRRWLVTGVAVLIVLFLLVQMRGYGVPSLLPSSPSTASPEYEPPPRLDGKWRWSDVPTRYPVSALTPVPTGIPARIPSVQHSFGSESGTDLRIRTDRQQAVKNAFTRCWASYRNSAWLKDELSPLSGLSRQSFGGWAATLVDSLDTLYIMGMEDELEEAIEAAATIDFTSSTDNIVNIFETTIRYLGGFLSAYDLTQNKILLNKAVEVGEMLYVAFDTPNHMPITRWDWQKAANGYPQVAWENCLVSEIGSLSLEFTRLSQLTGDPKWYDAIARITRMFDEQQSSTNLPGMWPVSVDAEHMNLTKDSFFSLGGMSDSTYEYFPKEYALLGGLDPIYEKLYLESMAIAQQYLFFRPMTHDEADVLISGNARAISTNDISLDPQFQHLTCFVGGMLALGGKLFSRPQDIETGRKLTDGCIWAYNYLPSGIMPETSYLIPCSSRENCSWNSTVWKDEVLLKAYASGSTAETADQIIREQLLPPGFTSVSDTRYILRPEAIESIFILYRITGDPTLRDAAWKMFSTIQERTETEWANAELDDVRVERPSKTDRMESFWLAETLKYFYLIFSEPTLISLDEFVFNTEAHPFRRPR
jgi:mannosyl-oligosaccharide alpha-1,2-mannosidase